MAELTDIKHRTKFIPMLVFISVGTEVFGMLLIILAGLETKNILVPSVIFSAAWGLIWAAIMSIFFVITIKEHGVRAYNFWGACRLVEWNNIQRCKPINLLGLKYVRVFTNDKKSPIWLPTFVQDIESLKSDILLKSKASNCLTTYFSTL